MLMIILNGIFVHTHSEPFYLLGVRLYPLVMCVLPVCKHGRREAELASLETLKDKNKMLNAQIAFTTQVEVQLLRPLFPENWASPRMPQ